MLKKDFLCVYGSVQIYFIIKPVQKMIFEKLGRYYCLHLQEYPVFEVPFHINREESLPEVRCNIRMDIQNKNSCFNLSDNKCKTLFNLIGKQDSGFYFT